MSACTHTCVCATGLAWEGFFTMLGAGGHLDPGGCCAAAWWTVVQQTDLSQLRGLECAVCCQLLQTRNRGFP